MKRLTHSIPLSAMAVLLFVSVAVAQSSPDQTIPNQYGTGQYGTNQYGTSQYAADQSTPNQDPGMVNNILKSVTIRPSGFDPAKLQVQPGTTVQWNNLDGKSHTVTSDDGAFDSGEIKPGQTFRFKFDEPGEWKYHSELDSNMTGSITVDDPSGGGATTPAGSTSPTQTTEDTTQTVGGS